MTEIPKKYTLEEDDRIWAVAEQFQSEGKPLSLAFQQLSEELDRSQTAIDFRYYSVLKKRKQKEKEQDDEQDQEQDDKLDQGQAQEEFQFIPYVAPERRKVGRPPGNLKQYTSEEDDRIWAAITFAENEGIPQAAIYEKLAEDLDRTPKAMAVRCHLLKRQRRQETQQYDDEEEDDGSGGVLGKLKAIVKERDSYKSKYEAVEDKLKDYDRMAKELRQIRRLLE